MQIALLQLVGDHHRCLPLLTAAAACLLGSCCGHARYRELRAAYPCDVPATSLSSWPLATVLLGAGTAFCTFAPDCPPTLAALARTVSEDVLARLCPRLLPCFLGLSSTDRLTSDSSEMLLEGPLRLAVHFPISSDPF